MGKKAPTEDEIVISYMGESMTMRELKNLKSEGGINIHDEWHDGSQNDD